MSSKKEIVYGGYIEPPKRVASPVDYDGEDSWIWAPIASLLEEKEGSVKTSFQFDENDDELLDRKVKISTDKKGRKGIWITLHGRPLFIPLNKIAKYGSLALAVPAAFTGALMATSGGRALLKALAFKTGATGEVYVAKRGLFYAMKHPRTTLAAVRIANRMEEPVISYYALPKGIKADPEYLLFDGFTVSGRMAGTQKSEFVASVSAAARDTLEVNLIKVNKKQVSGLHVMKELMLTAQTAKKKKILFQANITEGTYMWARLGADWVETPLTKKARRTIANRLRRQLPEFSRLIISEKIRPYEIFRHVSKELGPSRAKKVFMNTKWNGMINMGDPIVQSYLGRLMK